MIQEALRLMRSQKGVTGLEVGLILVALMVVAAVFACAMPPPWPPQ